jgi:hypothetical protein
MSVVAGILEIDQVGYTLDRPRLGLGKVVSDYLNGYGLTYQCVYFYLIKNNFI